MNDLYNCNQPDQVDVSIPGDLYVVKREDGTGGNVYVEGVISGCGGGGGTDLTQEVYGIVGDGETTAFEIPHTLSAGIPTAQLIDDDGLVCLTTIELDTDSARVFFSTAPAVGDNFTLTLTGRKEAEQDGSTSDEGI